MEYIKSSSKLMKLLVTLNQQERKRFYDFLNSPYFNKRTDVYLLYKLLDTNKELRIPMKETFQIPSNKILRKLFPENYSKEKKDIRIADYARLRNSMSELSKLLNAFILQLGTEKNNIQRDRILIDELMLRKLYSDAQVVYNKSQQKLSSQPFYNRNHFFNQFRLEEVHFSLNIIQKNRSVKNNVEQVITPFQHYYYVNILMYCCAAINQMRILNTCYELSFMDELIHYLSVNLKAMPALIKIYFHILMFLKEVDSKTNFLAAKHILEEQKTSFDSTDIRWINGFLLNYCNAQIRKGAIDYRRKQFEIYQNNWTSGIWNNGLYLSTHHFNNFVRNALTIKEVDAAEQFIERFKSQIAPADRENMINLSYAQLFFTKGMFKQAGVALNRFEEKVDFFYKIYAKTMLIKLLYESGKEKDLEDMEDALEAFRVYLNPKRSQALSAIVRKSHFEFRRLANHLYSCTYDPAFHHKIPKLIEEIKLSDNLAEREWLLQKATLLRQKYQKKL